MTDNLTVKIVSGTSESLQVSVDLTTATVLSLKHCIEQKDPTRYPISSQRLIFQGQILQDAKLLTEYNVTGGCALHLTLLPRGNATSMDMVPPPSQLRTLLQQMKDYESLEAYTTAVQTLQKICSNIIDHPNEDKYRKLRMDNEALKMKLFDRIKGMESVKLLGFQDGVQTGHLVLVPTPDKWNNLVACKAVVDSVATAMEGAALTNDLPFGAMPSMSSGGGFAAQTQTLLQNPAILQSIANNPMVQQMSQQNPILAQALQNPALLAQSIQSLQQNPAMMQQMNQMMSNPNGMAQMQQMRNLSGLSGHESSPFVGTTPFPSATNPFATDSTSSNSFTAAPLASASTVSTASIPACVHATPPSTSTAATLSNVITEESFDEDEIANAIARSLQDE